VGVSSIDAPGFVYKASCKILPQAIANIGYDLSLKQGDKPCPQSRYGTVP